MLFMLKEKQNDIINKYNEAWDNIKELIGKDLMWK